MTFKALADEWLEKAHEEELFANSILTHRDAPPWGVGFHSHQLAEKSLKAYLVFKGAEFPKIHQLDRLVALCAELDAELNDVSEDAQIINSYYFEERYPGPHPRVSWEEAEAALYAGRRINELVCEKIISVSKS